MHLRFAALAAAAILFLAAACGSSSDTPDPNATFCSALKGLRTSVVAFKKLNKANTLADFQGAATAVQTSFQAVKGAGTLAAADASAFEAAVTNLVSAAGALPTTDTGHQAGTALQPYIEAVGQARDAAGTAFCGDKPTQAGSPAAS